FWHEWVNFRVKACDAFVEKLVGWAIEAGLPAGRVFTHQTTASSSYNANRATGHNEEWLDDWSPIEASGGKSRVSIYRPDNLVNGQNHYANLLRRDDAWGSPEFNPYVKAVNPSEFASQAEVQMAVANTWPNRA